MTRDVARYSALHFVWVGVVVVQQSSGRNRGRHVRRLWRGGDGVLRGPVGERRGHRDGEEDGHEAPTDDAAPSLPATVLAQGAAYSTAHRCESIDATSWEEVVQPRRTNKDQNDHDHRDSSCDIGCEVAVLNRNAELRLPVSGQIDEETKGEQDAYIDGHVEVREKLLLCLLLLFRVATDLIRPEVGNVRFDAAGAERDQKEGSEEEETFEL
mmetsp:Transcript_15144/g.32663  ORF Transcript_15144/g.32663 Transcript_15144/m.32663 type:complete len:212 (+) Transcript_15144:1308-1943(+)